MGGGASLTAWADDTGTITIVPPSGTANSTNTEYKVYKIFDATVTGTGENRAVSYRVKNEISYVPIVSEYMPSDENYDKSTTEHFILDSAGYVYWGTEADSATEGYTAINVKDASGNVTTTYFKKGGNSLSQAGINAIAHYVEINKIQAAYTLTANGANKVQQSGVPYGYYYVTTQTGSAVSVGTNNPNATIQDKNQIPTVTKKITAVEDNEGSITSEGKAAIAEVGKKVTYTSTVTFNKGSKVIAFHDTMGSNLSYNNDAKVVINKVPSSGTTTDVTSSINYTGKGVSGNKFASAPYVIESTPASGDTITISFPDDLDKQAGTDEVIQAVITYTATVTSDALTVDPEQNTAYITYGDNNAKTEEQHTYVYNAKIVVTKTDGSNSPLAGASFILSRKNGETTQYYKYTAATQAAVAKVEWVTDQTQATVMNTTSTTTGSTTTINNVVTFSGLPDGTYTLIETQAPSGYTRAADLNITINGVGQVTYENAVASSGNLYKYTPEGATATIDNLNKGVTVVNEAGSALPHTGGIGTTIFYIVGGVLIACAAGLLIARRRKA